MNQKKCPKCGENNPVEAVMCWACYTPLSGATAGVGGGAAALGSAPVGGPQAAKASRDTEKKAIPLWQYGVIGVALLAMAGGAYFAFGGSSDTTPPPDKPTEVVVPPRIFPPRTNTTTTAPNITGTVPVPPAPPSPAPQYRVTTQPNPNSSLGVLGLYPTQPTDERGAAVLAANVRERMSGKWKNMYIYVFRDQQTARKFQDFQGPRKGAPLGPNDYPTLRDVWSNTLVRADYIGNTPGVRYPSQSPSGWWYDGGSS